MSVQNFIPTVWAARIERDLEARYVYANFVNRDYEGDISGYGDTVSINSVGSVTVDDYVKNSTEITPEELNSSQQTLDIDQSKYFAFYIDDVDNAQTKPKLMDEGIRKASRGLAKETDDFVRDTMVAGAGITGTDLDTAIVPNDVPEWMGRVNQLLDENDNDEDEGRFIIVPPWLKKLIVISFQGNTESAEVQTNGRVGRYWGIDVHMSNRVSDNSGNSQIIAGTMRGMTMAEQIVQTEAYRPESSFSDAVKGLHVYGGRVVQPNALLLAETSES